MTDNLEQRLTAEFRAGDYDIPVDAVAISGAVRRRRARRSTAAVGASVVGIAVLAVGGVAVVRSLPPGGTASVHPATSGQASQGPGQDLRLAGVPVRSLPAGARPAVDAKAALAVEPTLESLPESGDRAVLSVNPPSGGVTRIVVVVDSQSSGQGLPGVPGDYEWLGRLQGAKGLATDHAESSTAYFTAGTPSGRWWFVAVTGADEAGRLAVLEAIVTNSVPST